MNTEWVIQVPVLCKKFFAYNDGTIRPDDRLGILYGDVDGDGKLTVMDATHMLKKVADPTYIFPIELSKETS